MPTELHNNSQRSKDSRRYLPNEESVKLFTIITFLQMIHVSLKEGWFNCGGKNERLWFTFHKNLYTWECINVAECSRVFQGEEETLLLVSD